MKSLISPLLYVLVLSTLGISYSSAQNPSSKSVIPLQQRRELIAKAEVSLDRNYSDLVPIITEQVDPFATAVVKPAITDTNDKVPEVNEPVILSDDEVLDLMAKALSPQGMIQMGNTKILNLGKARSLRVSDSFKIVHNDITYSGEITDMASNSFTLKFNSSTKTFAINSVRPGSIKRSGSEPTESTNP